MVASFDGVEFYNVDEVDGLAEAAFFGVLATPTIIVTDGAGKERASWRDGVPTKEELESCLTAEPL
ncbi:MAG: thioredoxin domain-containing protein [Candidatus Aquicultorales bacterium]